MLRVEFHCHTIYSKDSLTPVEKLIETCRRRRIDRVVITDHNTIAGAVQAQQIEPERVILGEEILTTRGEILAAFVQEEIPAGLEPPEVIARLRQQGAFISVSHPFDHRREGAWRLADLQAIAPLVDAIEVFNARCLLPTPNRQALAFARQHGLPGTVGSDAHAAYELGMATLLLPEFTSADELKQVIRSGEIHTRRSGPWVFLASRYAKLYKKYLRKKVTQE
ncbi:MAG: PHP domain-containing protein [Anaerolineales bacterium]|nr:PHP domain-containing protein [Anaerolineales bacterium]